MGSERITILEIASNKLVFSSGHFTIFSATERETLHGHNYHMTARIEAAVGAEDLTFDYRDYKKKLTVLCQQLNNYFLLPAESPYLKITENEHTITARFDQDDLVFLKKDAKLLPIKNVTLEGLSQWFLTQLLSAGHIEPSMRALTITVFNGPFQSATASWERAA
jgi:6-pyruvoyltetrahydropterin/6-carboxytetrahydropterin synthase